MISLDFKEEVLKATPIAGTVAGDAVSRLVGGFTINEWFYIAAIAYVIAQIAAKIVDTIISWKKQERIHPVEQKRRYRDYDDYEDMEDERKGGLNDRDDESKFD